jgi:hypothetical protein
MRQSLPILAGSQKKIRLAFKENSRILNTLNTINGGEVD